MAIRVVVAEDNALLREDLAQLQLVTRAPDLDLVGAVEDFPHLLAAVERD